MLPPSTLLTLKDKVWLLSSDGPADMLSAKRLTVYGVPGRKPLNIIITVGILESEHDGTSRKQSPLKSQNDGGSLTGKTCTIAYRTSEVSLPIPP